MAGPRLSLLLLAVAVSGRDTWKVGYQSYDAEPHYHWDANRGEWLGACVARLDPAFASDTDWPRAGGRNSPH